MSGDPPPIRPRPSPWLARLVARLAPPGVRQLLQDDLTEAHTRRARTRGRLGGFVWCVRELARSIVPLIALRLRDRPRESAKENAMTIESVRHDLRYTLRMLWRSPGFALVAIATIALGIGANTAIFSIVNALLLRPLPYTRPAELVTVWRDLRARGGPQREWATPANLVDWRAERSLFAAMASVRGWNPTLTGLGDPEPLRGEQVTDGYFDVLATTPALGRALSADDALPAAPRVVLLSDRLWRRRFGADPAVLGRRIMLGGDPHEIVGVLPAGFRPSVIPVAELWRPDRINLANPSRGAVVLRIVARVQPGLSPDQIAAATAALARRLEQQHPESEARTGIAVVGMHEQLVGRVRPGLLAVFGAVLFVLLIACVNIANLLLARAAGRTREMALRAALGAGRRRVVRQLLTESVVLAALGSLAGLLVSVWAIDALVAFAPANTPRLSDVGLDANVLLFSTLLTLVTGVVFGLAPAIQLSRSQLAPSLKDGGRGHTGRGSHRVRQILVIAEVAVALVLLVGGGLFLRSFLELRRADLGFNPDHVLVGFVSPPAAKYPTEPYRQAFFDRVLERAAALPGVVQAAASSVIPLSIGDTDLGFVVEGAPPPPTSEETPATWYRLVSHAYFDVLQIPIRRGRAFEAREAAPVVIVNESLARKHWPAAEAVGGRVRFGGENTPWYTVVGVAADVKQTGARGEARLQAFIPYWHVPEQSGGMSLVLKTAAPPDTLVQPLRQAVREIDPDIPVSNVMPMSRIVAESIDEPRFLAFLVGLFAALALAVASIGVYGLLSFTVTARRTEIGVRLALGARRWEIFRLVLTDGLRLVLVGIALGLAGAFTLAPTLRSLLFGIPAADPATFAVMALLLMAIAALATIIPARRATRVDPVVALRGD